MNITPQQLAAMIDHSLLKPFAGRQDIQRLCSEAVGYGFKAVCVNPVHVEEAVRCLRAADVLVCSVVGFPLGTHSPATKARETREAVRSGAREIDMVMRLDALKEGDDETVLTDIRAVVDAATGNPVKVILEICYLTDEEKRRGCLLAKEAGAAFVKTSTGFAVGGATVEDVKLLRQTVGSDFGVKAAGGIKTLEDALHMIAAGANRLGTSASVGIINQIR
ncbi:MAG: deoxyribose-phosphate aldolase [Deltaproteobacteria bacterium]|nr:deoxyribose-phosphate aldolase [Deltaproteobacteria bacterium]